jgi:hypothetical protein
MLHSRYAGIKGTHDRGRVLSDARRKIFQRILAPLGIPEKHHQIAGNDSDVSRVHHENIHGDPTNDREHHRL